jgi:hypothetical protein
MDQQMAETVVQQIGVQARMELAHKSTTYSDAGVMLLLAGASVTNGKKVVVRLTGEDLYDIEVYSKMSKKTFECRKLASASGIFADMLGETMVRLVFGSAS